MNEGAGFPGALPPWSAVNVDSIQRAETDGMTLDIRRARKADLGEIERLLRDAELTTLGVADHLRGFLVAEDARVIVGCAGLETYGASALLRSVVVSTRLSQIGGRLVEDLLDRAPK